MRPRTAPVLCLSLALLGLALSIYKVHFPPGPIADEPAYVMMTQSLWHDHNLRFEERDLQRAYRIWDLGPTGLILSTNDGGKTMHYAKPFVYSLAAVPFYVLFGVQGFVVFNMTLFVAMLWGAWWFWRDEPGQVGLYLGGFFFASAAYAYVFWMQPEVFNMACVFFPLLIWMSLRRRAQPVGRQFLLYALAGALLAAAFVSKEPTVALGAPIAIDLLWRRRWTSLAALTLPALIALALLWGAQFRLTGSINPYLGVQRRSFESEFPFETRNDPWALYRGTSFGSWSALGVETTPRMLLRDLYYFVVGRHTGLLPYFPFALFAIVLFFTAPRDGPRWLLAGAVAAYCLVLFVMRPNNYHGGSGFIGNRYFASIYPALLFLPGRLAVRRSLALPFLAAGLWTAPVVAEPLMQLAPENTLQAHVRSATFQMLPLELTLLNKIPGYYVRAWTEGTVWIVPKNNFFGDERHGNGVWVRGASRSEVTLVASQPVPMLHVRLFSLSDQNEVRVDSGCDAVVVRFDTAEKRQGTPVDLKLCAVARDLGFFDRGRAEYFYRFTFSSSDGIVPARRDPQSQDPRYLGTFVSFNGGAP